MYKIFKASAFERTSKTPEIHAVQYDSARVIPVFIYDLDFSHIEAARVIVRKPSGRRVCVECSFAETSNEKTVVLVPLTSQSLAECGTAIGQIQLDCDNESGAGQISTFKFFIKVEKNYSGGNITSSEEYENINKLILLLKEAVKNMPTEEFTAEQMHDVWDGPLDDDLSDSLIV